MQDVVLTPGTVVVAALLVAWAVWAVRRIAGRGLCDCGDHCGDGGCSGSCSGCASSCGCAVADKMVADAGRALDKSGKPQEGR